MATTTTEAKATTEKKPRSPEKQQRTRIGRTIGRGVWVVGYNAENPKATNEERKAAWKEVRQDFSKIGRKAHKALEKNGFMIVPKPKD